MFKILSNLCLLILLLQTAAVSGQGNCDPVAPPNTITVTNITMQSAIVSWDTILPNAWHHVVLSELASGLIIEDIVTSQNTRTYFNLVAGTGYKVTISSSVCETGVFGGEAITTFNTPHIIIDDVAMLVPNPNVNQQPDYTPANILINEDEFGVLLIKNGASGPGQAAEADVYHAYFYAEDYDGADFFEFTLTAGFDNKVHFPKVVNTSNKNGYWITEARNQWDDPINLDKPGIVNFQVSYFNNFTGQQQLKLSINLLNTVISQNGFLPITIQRFDTGKYFYGQNNNFICTGPVISCTPGGNGALPLEDDQQEQNGSLAVQIPPLQIAPNPFRQTVTIDLGKSWEQMERIVVTGPESNVVFVTSTPAKSEKIQLSTAHWPPGIYYLHLQTLTNRHVYALLKVN